MLFLCQPRAPPGVRARSRAAQARARRRRHPSPALAVSPQPPPPRPAPRPRRALAAVLRQRSGGIGRTEQLAWLEPGQQSFLPEARCRSPEACRCVAPFGPLQSAVRWSGPVPSCFCVSNILTPPAPVAAKAAKALRVLQCCSWIKQTEWCEGKLGTFNSDASGTSKFSSLERTVPSLGFKGPDWGAMVRGCGGPLWCQSWGLGMSQHLLLLLLIMIIATICRVFIACQALLQRRWHPWCRLIFKNNLMR